MVRSTAAPHAGHMEPTAVDDPIRTPPGRPPVRRSTTDRHLGGVSRAVADYLGVSVTLARVGLVAAVLVGGLGLAVYTAVWLFVPDDAGRVLIHGQTASSSESLLAALFAGVSALIVGSWVTRDGPSILVAILVTVGVFILSRRDGGGAVGPPAGPGGAAPQTTPPPAWPAPPAPPAPAPQAPPAPAPWPVDVAQQETGVPFEAPAEPDATVPFDAAAPAELGPVAAPAPAPSPLAWSPAPSETGVLPLSPDRTAVLPRPAGRGDAVGVATQPERAAPPRPPKPLAFLGPLTVSIAVALAGSLMLLHAVGAIELRPSDIFIVVLAVVGLGLLVSTWFGRARGLILLGLLLIPVVAVSAVADRVDLRGGIGDRTWAPEGMSQLRDEYRLGAGSMQLDLTRLDPGSTDPVRTEMSLGAGQLQLVVPQDWALDIDAGVDIGSVWFYDHGVLVPASGELPARVGSNGGELRGDLIGGQDWYFPDREDVTNDGSSSSGNLRSLHVDGAEGAPTLDVDLHVTAGVVEVFRVQS